MLRMISACPAFNTSCQLYSRPFCGNGSVPNPFNCGATDAYSGKPFTTDSYMVSPMYPKQREAKVGELAGVVFVIYVAMSAQAVASSKSCGGTLLSCLHDEMQKPATKNEITNLMLLINCFIAFVSNGYKQPVFCH